MHITRKIDMFVIGLTALVLVGVIGYARPLVISPIDGLTTTNNSVLFAFSKADTIMIDDNPEFTSPEVIMAKDNLVVRLPAGTYYWKIKGAIESKVHNLTIESKVDLMLRPDGDEYEVVNAGNTQLDVSVYNGSDNVKNMSLGVERSGKSSGTLFVGRDGDE